MSEDPRLAGQVPRYHTWPHLRGQSIAEHSWQVVRIIWAIMPDAPMVLVKQAVFHDIGEVGTGDPPYPVKAKNPVLKKEMDRLERDFWLQMCLPWGVPAPQNLATHAEGDLTVVLKIAEWIDCWEWALHELSLGNRHAQLVRERAHGQIYAITGGDGLSEDIRKRVLTYVERRTRKNTELGKGINNGT